METADLISYIEGATPRLEINKFELDMECQRQASFYAEVSAQLPGIKRDFRQAKGRFEFEKADLSLGIRKNPELYGLPAKNNNDTIDACVIMQQAYQNAQTDMFEAERNVHVLEVLVNAVEQRKSMLRDLVTLFEKDYYNAMASEPMRIDTKKIGESRANDVEEEIGRSGRER